MPKFNIYNDQTYSADHVRYYQEVMPYWFLDDDVLCRMFPASMGDAVLRWFTRLPVGKIDNFRELAEQFTARFIINN